MVYGNQNIPIIAYSLPDVMICFSFFPTYA